MKVSAIIDLKYNWLIISHNSGLFDQNNIENKAHILSVHGIPEAAEINILK